MKELTEIDLTQLRECIKALNDLDLLDSKIKTIGVKKENLVEAFAEAIEEFGEDSKKQKKIPTKCVELFNFIYEDEKEEEKEEEEEEEEEEEKEEEEKEEEEKEEEKPTKKVTSKKEKESKFLICSKKVEKKEKKVKPKKAPKELAPYGSGAASMAGKIEFALAKKATIKEIQEATGASVTRIRGHFQYLKGKGFTINSKDGKYWASK